jgi:hypothetical protein
MACPCGSSCGRSLLAADNPPEQARIEPRGIGVLVSCVASRGTDPSFAMAWFGHRLLGLTAERWPCPPGLAR